MRHIAEDLLGWARKSPDKPLLIDVDGKAFSYGEAAASARALAGDLKVEGVGPGDRVLLLLPNGVHYLSAYYGTLLVGAIAVGMPMLITPVDLGHIVRDCEPRLCLLDSEHVPASVLRVLANAAVQVRTLRHTALAPPYPGSPVGGGEDIAQIIYTSGTTGKAKGVMLSHRALWANSTSIVEYLHLQPDDRVGVVLDFVYSYGNSLLHTQVRVGGSLSLLGSLAFPVRVLDLLEQRQCTGFSGVPSTFALLLEHGVLEGRRLKTLRYTTCAGASLPRANLERLRRLLPHVTMFLMYGQTEASARLSYLPPEELDRRPHSIGKGIPGVVLQVLRPDSTPVGEGEEGEIVASGENLMSGYWKDTEATLAVMRGGKLWTGDLGVVDGDGFITITGRSSDLIKVGAFRLHPLEVEEAIVLMPGVHECTVVGVPDPIWGESLVACFPRGSVPSLNDIRKHLRGILPEYKWPRHVAEVDDIPRTSSGKIRRRELAAQLVVDTDAIVRDRI